LYFSVNSSEYDSGHDNQRTSWLFHWQELWAHHQLWQTTVHEKHRGVWKCILPVSTLYTCLVYIIVITRVDCFVFYFFIDLSKRRDQKRQHNCVHYYAQKCLSADMWPEHFLQFNISKKTVEDLCSNNGIYKHGWFYNTII